MIAANLLTLAVAAGAAVAAPVYKRASGTATYYAAGLGKFLFHLLRSLALEEQSETDNIRALRF